MVEPAGVGKEFNQIPAGIVDVTLVLPGQGLPAPVIQSGGQLPVPVGKKRPVKKAAVNHQSPLNTGFSLFMKAV